MPVALQPDYRFGGATDAGRRKRRSSFIAGIRRVADIEHRNVAGIRAHEERLFEAIPRTAEHSDLAAPHVITVADRTIAYRQIRYVPVEARQIRSLIQDARRDPYATCANFRCFKDRNVTAVRAAKVRPWPSCIKTPNSRTWDRSIFRRSGPLIPFAKPG